jgi:hypothetical protein
MSTTRTVGQASKPRRRGCCLMDNSIRQECESICMLRPVRRPQISWLPSEPVIELELCREIVDDTTESASSLFASTDGVCLYLFFGRSCWRPPGTERSVACRLRGMTSISVLPSRSERSDDLGELLKKPPSLSSSTTDCSTKC